MPLKRNKTSNNRSHLIRIIGGDLKGQKVKVIDSEGLRPTSDRVRETLFNWLYPQIVNANCLDLFAGSGILGFESISRGAKKVIALEIDPNVVSSIELSRLKLKLKLNQYEIIQNSALDFLEKNTQSFDVIFLDPPFLNTDLLISSLESIINKHLLNKGGLIYLELAKKYLIDLEQFNPNLIWLKKKMAGQVCYALLTFK